MWQHARMERLFAATLLEILDCVLDWQTAGFKWTFERTSSSSIQCKGCGWATLALLHLFTLPLCISVFNKRRRQQCYDKHIMSFAKLFPRAWGNVQQMSAPVWETSWTAFFCTCTHKQQTEKQKARTESNKKTNSPMVQESGLTSLTVIYSRLSVPTFRAHMWAHTVSHPQKGMLTSGLVKMIRPWNKRHCYTGRKDGNFSVISGFQKILKVKILFSIYMCVYHVFL